MFVLVVKVNAETVVRTETELRDCITAAGTTEATKAVCKLGSDIELTDRITIESGKYVEIILGEGLGANRILVKEGHDVNIMFNVKQGVLKLTGPGGIFAPKTAIQILANFTPGGEARKAEVVVGKDVQVISEKDATITIYGKGAKLDVYGTVETKADGWATISSNGTLTSSIDYGNTVINIYDGAVVKNEKEIAIFHPQNGELNVYGGEITGTTGVEMRAGKITVKGGTIVGTAVPTTTKENGSGSTTEGAGIAIVQHTTEQNLAAVISGGTVKGYTALYHNNTENNSDAAAAKVSLEVTGGTFEATNNGQNAIYSDAKENFITGGEFVGSVNEKFVSNQFEKQEVDGIIYVGASYNVKLEEVENGEVTLSTEKAVAGQPVKLTFEAAKGYKLSKAVYVGADKKEVEIKDGKFVMPEEDVTVTVTFEKEEVKETVKEENPNTGDSVMLFVIFGLIGLVGTAVATNKLRKNA